ncbi:unnamed protein product [Orchesella dallaii]|uniref:Uncharacterized protein n=1 Tax=Orchesella dallaii TaxID=48710 RepID=A0ABP1S3M5_9HEXA
MADDNDDVPENLSEGMDPEESSITSSENPSAEPEAPPLPPPEPEPEASPPPELEVPPPAEPEEPPPVEKSTTSVSKREKSTASVNGEASSKSVKAEASSKSVSKLQDAAPIPEDEDEPAAETDPPPPTPTEPEQERKPVIEVVPLGPLTEEAQRACEYIPFILDKMFHEGTAGRLNSLDPAAIKAGAGGNIKYEDYQWQLEKLYRQVPENMVVAAGRYKPDQLLYEGEKFVLGKLFRDIREKEGYDPTAQREESALDLTDAIQVHIRTLPPEPCPRPYVMEVEASDNEKCVQFEPRDQMRFGATGNPQSGKVFQYSYAPIMALDMESECDRFEAPEREIPRPTTPHSCTASKAKLLLQNEADSKPCPGCGASKANLPNNNVNQGCEGCGGQQGAGFGAPSSSPKPNNVCRNNLRCESNIQSVCQAARSAMAIYDTLTGCDNFPCNIGDRPERELQNIEDGVWNWLYQVILKMIPKDSNANPEVVAAASILNTIKEEPGNEEQCE